MSVRPSVSKDVDSFDHRSSGYEQSFLQGFFFDRVHQAALSLLPADVHPGSILDIGCGTGRLLRKAASRWPEAQLIGVDPAEGMIAVAHQQTPHGTFYISMAESLPLPDASVDLVLSTASFHHWADQAEGVRQVARALRAGGYFCLADIVPPYGGLEESMTHYA